MIKETIAKLVKKEDLTRAEAAATMNEIMSGSCTDAQIAAYLTALRMKGETVEEITGSAETMREKSTKIPVRGQSLDLDREDINLDPETILDTCGTGGTGTNTFNISTVTAFVVAATGVKVAKHGNRAASSACGSADVLEALGVNLQVTPEQVAGFIQKIGIGFLFAQLLHSAMKYAGGVRKELGVRTVFNVLGPLTNPAGATAQVLGVYAPDLTRKLAAVLMNLGTKRAYVVHGADTLDELTLSGETYVSELRDGQISNYQVHPADFGLTPAPISAIRGGDAATNAKIIMDVLNGENGPHRDIVLLNAAFALCAAGKTNTPMEGISLAAQTLDNGKALATLIALKELSQA